PSVTETLAARDAPKVGNKKILVVGIYLAAQQNNVDDIVRVLSGSQRHQVSQRWIALQGDPPTEMVADVTVGRYDDPTPKFVILNEVLAQQDLDHYDYVMVCDDDVVLPERFVDEFFALQSRLGFVIAQPARTSTSYIDIPLVEQYPGLLARETLFVEQGPVISFDRRAIFDQVFPFDLTSHMGWGLENVWSLAVSERELAMGIIDNVPVDHSIRKPVANYDWNEADAGRTELLSKVRHRPSEECYKVVKIVPLFGAGS
ncbi:MAG: hypothetical protein K8R59_12735, partial [Thermoanaerobaculales bacterium]|nr:hypothetical protein [Thermoanaerobaculales bacterium]